PGSVSNKIRRQFFLTHLGQMRSIRAVVAADDEKEVHSNIEQLAQRVLPFLGRTADRIKEPEIFRRAFRPVTVDNGLADPALDLFGFAAQHRRLVRYADGFQVDVRIESRRMRVAKTLQKLLFVPAVPDVIANVIRVREGED